MIDSVAEQIPEDVKMFIGNKIIKANTFRIQAYNSVMSVYFCIEFIDFMLNNTRLADFTN